MSSAAGSNPAGDRLLICLDHTQSLTYVAPSFLLLFKPGVEGDLCLQMGHAALVAPPDLLTRVCH